MTRTVKGRLERLTAKICLWSLGAAVLVALVPDGMLSNRLFVGAVTIVAGTLLATWIYLMVNHVSSWFFERERTYTIGQVLSILFIPVIGAIWVSLRRTS
jgi:hypothetical protein